MANTTIDKIRIPWEYFEKRTESAIVLARGYGATEEQLEKVKKTMMERYEDGEFDIPLDAIFEEKGAN